MEEKTYRIYAKHKNQKRFLPIDGKANRVGNLIFAALFTEEKKDTVLKELRCLENEDWTFEARRIPNFER